MKKGQIFLRLPLLLMGVFSLFMNSCSKDDNGVSTQQGVPTISTAEVEEITASTALSGGGITSDGGTTVIASGVCWSTSKNPTINDNKTEDNSGAGTFTVRITNLTPNTTYYVRAYATNSVGTGYGNLMSFTTTEGGAKGTFTDARDGNTYKWVQIGNQVWMAENLAYLPSVSDSLAYSATVPLYYVYDYAGTDVNAAKATLNYNTYGVLYNWAAAIAGGAVSESNPSGVQGVCPKGWHLPSTAEWIELVDFAGGEQKAGHTLKESGTTWGISDHGPTNETGFTALPGGYLTNAWFIAEGQGGLWWSTTPPHTDFVPYVDDPEAVRLFSLYSTDQTIDYQPIVGKDGYNASSVRCVRD